MADTSRVLRALAVAGVLLAGCVPPGGPGGGPPPRYPYATTALGCAAGTDAASLDAFFAARRGPVLGWDHPRVTPLGPDRALWTFQDTFLDPSGTVTHLDHARFAHNVAVVQGGACFTLLHRGTPSDPRSWAVGPDPSGRDEVVVHRWWWPLGATVVGDTLWMAWAEMVKDQRRPEWSDDLGLPYRPVRTWIASYRLDDLAQASFVPAPDDGVWPLYGYGLATDGAWTYLFGNTYLQDFSLEGGRRGHHSATKVFLARVPAGRLDVAPSYWDGRGWSPRAAAAQPVSERFRYENPMLVQRVAGRWVAATKRDGFYGTEVLVETAQAPEGPWTVLETLRPVPRAGTVAGVTYHAQPLPSLHDGRVVVVVVTNARDMRRDAYPDPSGYRPVVVATTRRLG